MKKQSLVPIVVGGVLVTGLLAFSVRGYTDDSSQLKEQVKALQERVDQLETELANKQQAVMPPAGPVYDQWEDPFMQMARMREQMDRSMRQAFAVTGAFNPRMDMKQTDKQYVITMDLPGMDKDKINIEIKDGMLTVSGERKSETQNNKNNQYYRQELSFGSFMQAIPLPEDAKPDQIDAKYNNGVLTLTLPRMKKEEKRIESQKIVIK